MTSAQLHVYEVLICLLAVVGFPPTVRELARACSRGSTTVHYHLEGLRALGVVEWQVGKVRTLRVLPSSGQGR